MDVSIITATRHPTLQGVYWCKSSAHERAGRVDISGAEAAAAWLLQKASGASKYSIVGPAEVLASIPADLRHKR
jgi:hypothetical protein